MPKLTDEQRKCMQDKRGTAGERPSKEKMEATLKECGIKSPGATSEERKAQIADAKTEGTVCTDCANNQNSQIHKLEIQVRELKETVERQQEQFAKRPETHKDRKNASRRPPRDDDDEEEPRAPRRSNAQFGPNAAMAGYGNMNLMGMGMGMGNMNMASTSMMGGANLMGSMGMGNNMNMMNMYRSPMMSMPSYSPTSSTYSSSLFGNTNYLNLSMNNMNRLFYTPYQYTGYGR